MKKLFLSFLTVSAVSSTAFGVLPDGISDADWSLEHSDSAETTLLPSSKKPVAPVEASPSADQSTAAQVSSVTDAHEEAGPNIEAAQKKFPAFVASKWSESGPCVQRVLSQKDLDGNSILRRINGIVKPLWSGMLPYATDVRVEFSICQGRNSDIARTAFTMACNISEGTLNFIFPPEYKASKSSDSPCDSPSASGWSFDPAKEARKFAKQKSEDLLENLLSGGASEVNCVSLVWPLHGEANRQPMQGDGRIPLSLLDTKMEASFPTQYDALGRRRELRHAEADILRCQLFFKNLDDAMPTIQLPLMPGGVFSCPRSLDQKKDLSRKILELSIDKKVGA